MVPSSNVVTLTVRVVLQADGGHKVLLSQRRVQRHDLVVEGHTALLTIAPLKLLLPVAVDKTKAPPEFCQAKNST